MRKGVFIAMTPSLRLPVLHKEAALTAAGAEHFPVWYLLGNLPGFVDAFG